MIQCLGNYLTDKGYKLTKVADCYKVISPTGKETLANLRWKTKSVWGKLTKRWEWSIPLRDWRRYIGAKVETLFLYEKSTRRIYVAAVNEVLPHANIYQGDILDAGGTVFLPCDKYCYLATIECE